ncbi:MAG TPA: glycosyltransferase family 4 protein, partial [Pyrinomonadaceae bacterium]
MAKTWHIITGEYPPQSGGVSDYTEQLAAGLATSGCQAHVWCPSSAGATPHHERVEAHRFGENFSPRNLFRLGKLLNRFPAPRSLLVQYAPNAFGLRGLNIPFCCWLCWRSLFRRDDVRVMFHEPFFYFAWQRPQRNLLALSQRLMAMLLLAASRVVYLSIPAWEKMLGRYAWLRRPPMRWLPVPATIPRFDDSQAVAAIRRQLTNDEDGKLIVGHFGTYGEHLAPLLSRIFTKLLQTNPQAQGICLGGRGERFVDELIGAHPELKNRISATSFLSPGEVSLYLQACDLLVQPYPDGVSSRRTSVMAGLAHGLPIVTTTGFLSEKIWTETDCVALAVAGDAEKFVQAAEALLSDPAARARLADRARTAYEQNFALERTLKELCA